MKNRPAIAVLLAFVIGARAEERLNPASTMPVAADLPDRAGMPDPLITDDGRQITTPEQWNRRREQMKQIIEFYAIGHAPRPPGNVTGNELLSRKLMDGKVTFRIVHLAFGPERKLGFDVNLYIPSEADSIKAPFPTFVQPSFSANHNPGQSPDSLETDLMKSGYDEPLRRGYAIVTFNYQQCGADRKEDYRNSGFFPSYPGHDWGDLAAWAWAMSRCVDYLETQTFADKSRIIAIGHSRLGKTALVAGAFDERFALTASAGSGCGGTGAYRFNGRNRGGKEGWRTW